MIIAHRTQERKQLLSDHLVNTGVLCSLFARNFNSAIIPCLAGYIHDLGKSTSNWQDYFAEVFNGEKRKKIDHATVGAQILEEILDGKNILACDAVAAVVMYHHGAGLPDMLTFNGDSEFLKRMEKKDFVSDIMEIGSTYENFISSNIKKLITKDIIDTIGREELFSLCKNNCNDKKQFQFNMGLQLRNLSSCLIDADRTDTACFEKNIPVCSQHQKIDWDNLLDKLDSKIKTFSNDGLLGSIRKNLSDRCYFYGNKEKGLFTCSAFTGCGKTLASLRFALTHADKHHMDRIFIVAPYTSILDQNADVIRNILEDEESKGKIVLECHSNLGVEKKETLYESEENYSDITSNWDSPVVITTMVQFLESLFGSGTKKIRRMHQLNNSVIVFDEIQTLPLKCTYLFNWAIQFLVSCCGCSVLLCTATQPCLDKIGETRYRLPLLQENEIIENLSDHFNLLKRVEFIDKSNGGRETVSAQEVSSYIQEELNVVNSFLAVVNTKPQAKELYELIKHSECADSVFHLSTDMCPAHRKIILQQIKESIQEKKKVVCISTRLIEAGVDLSFEGALRYMAGLDSVIQTAGRCNRNGTMKCGKVAIFLLRDEKLGSLKELKYGQDCMEKVLREYNTNIKKYSYNLIQPELIELYFNSFYNHFPQDFLSHKIDGSDSTIIDLLSDNMQGRNAYGKPWPHPYAQAFKTAWENFEVIADLTTGVIVPYNQGKTIIGNLLSLEKTDSEYFDKRKEYLSEAQQYCVNIYTNQIAELIKNNIIFELFPESGFYAMNEGYYDTMIGFEKKGCNENFTILSF